MTTPTVRRPNFWDYVARYRKQAAILIVTLIVLFEALTFILPHNYESVATALPPEQSGSNGMMSALLSNSIAAEFLKGSGSENPTLDLFKTILESRNVAEEVAKDPKVRAFCARYDTSNDAIVSRLSGSVQGEALRTGMFTVTVDLKTGFTAGSSEDEETRKMSSYLANRFMSELDRFNRERLMTSAHATRVFIEKEYQDRLAQLDSSYKHLQEFQETNQAIALPEQLEATVTAASKLAAQIQQLQAQLAVEQHDLTTNSNRIQLLESQISAAKEQLQKYDDGGAGEYVLALKEVPQLTRQFAGYMREVKVLEQVTAFLRQQVEQERISEQRDLPSLQTLDAAKPPKQRSSPKRSVMGIVGLVFGLAVAFGYLRMKMISEGIKSSPEEHYRIIRFLDVLRGRQTVAAGADRAPSIAHHEEHV